MDRCQRSPSELPCLNLHKYTLPDRHGNHLVEVVVVFGQQMAPSRRAYGSRPGSNPSWKQSWLQKNRQAVEDINLVHSGLRRVKRGKTVPKWSLLHEVWLLLLGGKPSFPGSAMLWNCMWQFFQALRRACSALLAWNIPMGVLTPKLNSKVGFPAYRVIDEFISCMLQPWLGQLEARHVLLNGLQLRLY